MSFPKTLNVKDFLNDKVKTEDEALEGAKYIIAEDVSDNATYRKWIRAYYFRTGMIVSNLKKNAEDELKVYEMYYDYKEAIKSIKSHRVLALNRGEKENVLSVKIEVNTNDILSYLEKEIVKGKDNAGYKYVKEAIADAYKRLIAPSVEREVR